MTEQIHVRNGTSVQTLAAASSLAGVTFLSTIGGSGHTEIHIPVAALAWAIRMLGGERHQAMVAPIEGRDEEANDG